jgi:hypothetical protein
MESEIKENIVQQQWDMIQHMFRKTSEPYDNLEWDGKTLEVWLRGRKIETYKVSDLSEIIENFPLERNSN